MGKRSLLGAIYGVGPSKLRTSLNHDLANLGFKERVTLDECKEFLFKLKGHYSTHYEWIGDIKATVRETGVIESLTGRRRHLPHGRHNDNHALNQAINFPIQNLANDLNILAALQFGWRFTGGVLTTLVHDSGVADCRDLDAVDSATRKIRRIWKTLPTEEYFGFKSTIPLSITVGAGRLWHPLKEFQEVGELE
jgi:DNA polymerase I-like protein with 3'-5' exonuclease and polymerase domains